MRICVFHSSYEGSGCATQDLDNVHSQLGALTTQHTFEYRFIHKATAKQEIDAAVEEKFDFYFNLMWGTPDDPVAGVLESRYFESLGLPSCGIRSWERKMTKNDFYKNARCRGAPPVPGADRFPLVVRPANGSASQLSDEISVCHDDAELDSALHRINEALYEARIRRAEAMGIEDKEAYVKSYYPVGRDGDDIVIQEYVDGQDFSCSVIEICDACIALSPVIHKTKEVSLKASSLALNSKIDKETRIELLQKSHDAALFERLQQAAIEAFHASECKGSNMGCDVGLRVRPDGEIFVIEVNPQPVAFGPKGTLKDLPVTQSLPGGYPAVINIFIANHMLQNPENRSAKVAHAYNVMAPKYNDGLNSMTTIPENISRMVNTLDFSGTVFDLGCGTGVFGRTLSESQAGAGSCVIGFDISPGMLDICRETGVYHATYIDSFETALINYNRYAERVDHVVCFSAIHFLSPERFSLALVLCFALANKSINISIDEIPDAYNETIVEMGAPHMHSVNHMANMESFGEPSGWRLTKSERRFSWTSLKTRHDVYTTYFRFDRIEEGSGDLMFRKIELPN